MYNAIVLEHFHNPRNAGALDGATHYGEAGNPGEGPYMQFWMRICDDIIEAAHYNTFGCPAAVACGSMLAEVVQRKSVELARSITTQDLIHLLVEIPAGKEHCPELAVTAMNKALNCRIEEIEPRSWMRWRNATDDRLEGNRDGYRN